MGRLQNNPSIGWVHPKSTHAPPLAWGQCNNIMSSSRSQNKSRPGFGLEKSNRQLQWTRFPGLKKIRNRFVRDVGHKGGLVRWLDFRCPQYQDLLLGFKKVFQQSRFQVSNKLGVCFRDVERLRRPRQMTRFQVSKISGPGCGTRKSDGSRGGYSRSQEMRGLFD